MYIETGKFRGPKQGELVLTDILRVKCLRENVLLPKGGSEGPIGCDINVSYNYVIPSWGKGLVQMELSISPPTRVYAIVTPRSDLALKKFIDVGARVIDSDYRGELGVILFNHFDEDFKLDEGGRVAELILERIKIPIVQKVQD